MKTFSRCRAATKVGINLRSSPNARVSKGEAPWFETRDFAALLTMR